MKFLSKNNRILNLELSQEELLGINNAVHETLRLEAWEYPVRMGIEAHEAQALMSKLDNLIQKNQNQYLISISKDEAGIISNALNEVCNGMGVADFDQTIKISEKKARQLLDEVSGVS